MRSLLTAILSLFLPGRGAHRAHPAPERTSCPTPPTCRPVPARPYVAVWERERDDRERWRLQRQRRRAAAVLAGRGQGCFPWEAAV